MKTTVKKQVLDRLKRIEGQVRGLGRMVEEDAYCIDVISQSRAVKEAISGVEDVILSNHLRTHVVDQMRSGREEKAIEEILKVAKVSKRK